MSNLTNVGVLGALCALLGLTASCSVGDRCGDGYKYNGEGCVKLMDAGASADASKTGDAAEKDGSPSDQDSGEMNGDALALPTGLGKSCSSLGTAPECSGEEADYCAYSAADGFGICTIKGCEAKPNNCPSNYTCCDFPDAFGMPDICLPSDQYQAQVTAGICLQ